MHPDALENGGDFAVHKGVLGGFECSKSFLEAGDGGRPVSFGIGTHPLVSADIFGCSHGDFGFTIPEFAAEESGPSERPPAGFSGQEPHGFEAVPVLASDDFIHRVEVFESFGWFIETCGFEHVHVIVKGGACGSSGKAPELPSVSAEVVISWNVLISVDASLGGEFIERDNCIIVCVLSYVSTEQSGDIGGYSAAGCKKSFLGDVRDAQDFDEDFVLAVIKFINDSAHGVEFKIAPLFPVSDHNSPVCARGFLDTGFACDGGPGDGSYADHSENWGQIHAEEC